MDNRVLMVITWIRSNQDAKNVKSSLKELLGRSEGLLPPGTAYSCCEKFDTYFVGGLYPLLHFSSDKKVISMLKKSGSFLDTTIGTNLVVEQGLYEELVSIHPPCPDNFLHVVTVVAAFRSLDNETNEKLIKEWKGWTGARGFMLDLLEGGLPCHSVKFYVKRMPWEENNSFFYVVITEVGISSPRDEETLIDLLQRFRVERWLGFRSIYKPYKKIP